MRSERPPDGPSASEDAVETKEGGGHIIGSCIAVPEGRYELRYMSYRTGYFRDQAKVTVYFAIISPEDYAGVTVERFYNVDELKGRPRKYGNFNVSARRTLVREFSSLLGQPSRLDRISFVRLRDKRIVGEVETVTTNYEKRALSLNSQYSRVARLIQVLPDENW